MNILMMTNTFTPHVGGVARSIERFSRRFRHLGHGVKVVAPEFDGMENLEPGVIRVPAVRHFNKTDFSVVLPIPRLLNEAMEEFRPDVVHSHHPFLMGGTALRVAHTYHLPLVFTHHTKYEDYTHNVPGDSLLLKRFVTNLASNYANLCDQVFVPSESISKLVIGRGVQAPVAVVPTGVEVDSFQRGDGPGFRSQSGITQDAFVVGHLGRLSVEKNLPFLIRSIIRFMNNYKAQRPVHCLIVGAGPMQSSVRDAFAAAGLKHRLHMAGVLDEEHLADAYHAMNLFAFASKTETQGMVLTEAMASGVPVVAMDAPGVREVVENGVNGCLLQTQDTTEFANALLSIATAEPAHYHRLVAGAKCRADQFSMHKTADMALQHYSRLQHDDALAPRPDFPVWTDTVAVFQSEWQLAKSTARSAMDALNESFDEY